MKDISVIIKNHYSALIKSYQKLASNDVRFEINEKQYKKFEQSFARRRKYVLDNYMENSKSLDRHKLSAIVIIELILAKIVELKVPVRTDDNLALDEYLMATSTGFELMRYWLNKTLEKKQQPIVEKWYIPELLSCPDNEYYKVFARNLFFTFERSKEDTDEQFRTGFNELELAEKLYLFEQLTLIKNDIDMDALKEE